MEYDNNKKQACWLRVAVWLDGWMDGVVLLPAEVSVASSSSSSSLQQGLLRAIDRSHWGKMNARTHERPGVLGESYRNCTERIY
mmetsp:Transcript_10868/g.26081  ORF Transcript_10868/g.26081 Transcript_10868/m.26081 type:complete len:84 (-) Transcript_10868:40-291(-)